jgi:hypothetical protein
MVWLCLLKKLVIRPESCGHVSLNVGPGETYVQLLPQA